MLSLHLLFDDEGRAHLWAEDASRFGEPAPIDRETPYHPFSADGPRLCAVVEESVPLVEMRDLRAGDLALRLPSTSDHPLPSSRLATHPDAPSVEGSPELRNWRVSTLVADDTAALEEDDWQEVEEAMLERAGFAARLLTGEMPPEIERAFESCDTALFPRSYDEMRTRCSCPDSANPCKHLAAVFFLLAERFDDDPFAMFEWRGRTKSELLDNLRDRRDDEEQSSRSTDGEEDNLPTDPVEFWSVNEKLVGVLPARIGRRNRG